MFNIKCLCLVNIRPNPLSREIQLADQCSNLHKIEAIETTEVYAPRVQPKINTDNLPQELKLATIPFGTVKIEILIGLDSYYKFLGDQVIRLNEKLVAQKNPFGHIVSGVVGTSSDKAVLSHQLYVRSSSEQCNNYSKMILIYIVSQP